MSLVSLITKAGGIIDEGATVIRIKRNGDAAARPLSLPVRGLNIPFADVPLQDGDLVEVERVNPQYFMVIGLVNKPGAFPYQPGAEYTLLQALAFAAGVNDIADPKYARIYRQTPDGRIVDRTFRLKNSELTDASNVIIKPGDVVALEHTARTRFRLLLAEILRIQTGVNVVYRLDDKEIR
jgi:protein involved in polysaccharide export with SLBB domain